jgi:DNA polymerase III sliding clamp (beta) subunit (PCNA family)
LHIVHVYGDKLLEYLGLVKDRRVALSSDERSLTVSHDAGSASFPTLKTTLPKRDLTDEAQYVGTFKRSHVEELVKAAGFASIKRFHEQVGGTLLQSKDGTLRLVATDAYIIAKVELPDQTASEVDIIIPPDAFVQLQRIMRGSKAEMITLERKTTHFVGRCDSRCFSMALAAGKFPMWFDKIFPSEFTSVLTIDAPTLGEVVRRALLSHDDKDKAITIDISGSDLTVETPGSRETIQAISGTATTKLKMDGTYLRGVLDNTPAPQMDICIVDPAKPFIFVPAWPDGKASYLITPRTK